MTARTPYFQGTFGRYLEHGGRLRTYWVHLPVAYDARTEMALVLALHGGRGRGVGMERLTGFSAVADREGFIVVYPDGLDNLWKDGVRRTEEDTRDIDDVGFLAKLIDALVEEFAADARRIYATGISNGGHMVNRLACELSGRLAAIGPVSATMDASYARSHSPARPVAVIYFHGTEDPLRYYDGGGQPGGDTLSAPDMTRWWVEKNGCSPAARVEVLPPAVDDGTVVKRETYQGGSEDSEVVLYTIEGGGHTWPSGLQYLPVEAIGKTSRNIVASDVMWQFFSRHRRL